MYTKYLVFSDTSACGLVFIKTNKLANLTQNTFNMQLLVTETSDISTVLAAAEAVLAAW